MLWIIIQNTSIIKHHQRRRKFDSRYAFSLILELLFSFTLVSKPCYIVYYDVDDAQIFLENAIGLESYEQ